MKPANGDHAKRAIDVIGAGLGLALTSPLLIAASAAIVLTDGRPILFKQQRVGRNGTPFQILKFRSMRNGAPGLQVSSDRDPRITRVGSALRKSKVDELPQLINVLRGEMSIVGPRPEVPKYAARWPAELRPTILSIRPGITDPASITFRNEAEILARSQDPEEHYVTEILPYKAMAYANYVESRSLTQDLLIIVRTIVRVVCK